MYRVSYTATPYDEERRSWLIQHGVHVPAPGSVARSPSDAELRAALAQLSDYRVSFHWLGDGRYQAQVDSVVAEGPWTTLNVRPHTLAPDRVEFWFEQGWPIAVVQVAARIAAYSGPLVVVPDNGSRPLVVVAGIDPHEALAAW